MRRNQVLVIQYFVLLCISLFVRSVLSENITVANLIAEEEEMIDVGSKLN